MDRGTVITPETVQCIHLHGPSLCCMQHHTLTHDEYTLPLVRRGRWRLVRRGSNWRNLPHAHLQHVIAASHLLQRACPQRSRTQGTTSSFSFPTSTSETSLSSIARAVPRHRVHLNSGSGRKGPLMPLHFLITQRLQPPRKIALELPTPDWQTPQGYFPDFFSTSRLMPDSIIFVFPMFTRRPFFSISVFHVCTFTSSSSMDSALIVRSSAYSSSYGQPVRNSLDRGRSKNKKYTRHTLHEYEKCTRPFNKDRQVF